MKGKSVAAGAAMALWAFASAANAAELSLGNLFLDHMVLPRQGAVVYGTALPSETVNVRFGALSQSATADKTGAFKVALPDLKAGEIANLSVEGSSGAKRELKDVIAGDVFLCSGQSNMALEVRRSLNTDSVLGSSQNDTIRLLKVNPEPTPSPQARFKTPVAWEKAGPSVVANWSGACYFFADALQKRTKTPVGLVVAAYGGSNIRAWIDAPSLKTAGDFASDLKLIDAYAADPKAASRQFGKTYEAWWQKAGGGVSPRAPWQFSAADLKAWDAAPDVSLNWERWGVPTLADYTGGMWYALSFSLTKAQADQAADLALGLIDEIDMTWVNGQAAGYSSGAGTQRLYSLPKGTLKAGENVIVINVVDTWGNGGMYERGPRELRLSDGSKVALDTGWRYKVVPPVIGSPPRAPWDATGGLTTLSNAMIAPIGAFPFKAALWYQGESNTGDGLGYQAYMQALMRDWRARFGADLGFAIIQLANYGPRVTAPQKSGWAEVREAQRLAALNDARATVVTAVDIGDPYDIHPANKPELGRRLARAVAVKFYGAQGLSENGPIIANVTRSQNAVDVQFKGLEGALIAYGAPDPIGFELCDDADKACRYVRASVVASDTVRLSDANAVTAKLVRFCWADSPVCTLYDRGNGLPALPFQQRVP